MSIQSGDIRTHIKVIETTPGPNKAADVKALGKGIIMNVVRTFNNWRKYHQTVAELGRMTSHQLQDLGIGRDEIRSAVRASIAR